MEKYCIDFKKILMITVITALWFCVPCALASAEDYTFQSGIIYSYTGSGGDIIIPDTINGEKVVQIANYAFAYNENITSVSIPGSITKIGNRAFYDCSNLLSVNLSEGLITIGDEAFEGAGKISHITLPSSVQHIGNAPFDFNLVKLTIQNPDVTFDSGAESMHYYTYFQVPVNSNAHIQLTAAKRMCIVDEVIPHLYRNYSTDPEHPTTVYSGDMLNFDNAEGLLMSKAPVRKNDSKGYFVTGNKLFPNSVSYISGNDNEIEVDDGFFKFDYPVSLTVMPVIATGSDVQAASGDWIAAPIYYFLIEDPGVVEYPDLINLPIWGIQANNRGIWLDHIPISWQGSENALYSVELKKWSFSQTEGGSQGVGIVCHTQQGLTEASTIIPANALQHGNMYSITVTASVGSVNREAHSERFIVVEPSDDGVVSIPRNMLTIGEEGFMDDERIEEIRFAGENITSIGAASFMNCHQLRLITIPASVETIDEDAFSNCPNLVILCREGSVAQNYALENGIPCILTE